MSNCKVTERYVQTGANDKHGYFSCSCGLSYDTDMRKEPRRVALSRLAELHEVATHAEKEAERRPARKNKKLKRLIEEETVFDEETETPETEEDETEEIQDDEDSIG